MIFSLGQEICQEFKKFMGISSDESAFFISGWVEIRNEDIMATFAHQSEWDMLSLYRAFIDFIIQKINEESYGAGCVYELYEVDKCHYQGKLSV